MSKIKNIAIFVIIAVIVVTIGFFVFDIKNEKEENTDFSSYNEKYIGTKALYLLADRMGFYVSRYMRPSRFIPNNATMVALAPDEYLFNSDMEQKYLLEWIKRGNALVLIDDLDSFENDAFGLIEFVENIAPLEGYGKNYIGTVGKGRVIFLGNYNDYINGGLEALDPGVVFIDALNEAGHKRVLFNEYYHGLGSSKITIWDILTPAAKLLLVQLIIAALVLIFVVSRRFGKPQVVYEIVKRKENENLFALSNIYQKSKANGLVLESYLNNLKKELAVFLGFGRENYDDGEILAAAQSSNILKNINLIELFGECNNYINSGKKDNKEFLRLFKRLEQIRKEIKV